MFSLIDWYLNSLAEFWGMAIRIGLPQILLLILLICWMRKKRCGKTAARSSGKSCSWMWTCGCDGDCWFCRPPECQLHLRMLLLRGCRRTGRGGRRRRGRRLLS